MEQSPSRPVPSSVPQNNVQTQSPRISSHQQATPTRSAPSTPPLPSDDDPKFINSGGDPQDFKKQQLIEHLQSYLEEGLITIDDYHRKISELS